MIAMQPTTEGQLWDALQEMFGFGSWDEEGDQPWHRYRAIGVGMLKRSLKRWRLTVEQAYVTAVWCRQTGVHATSYAQLFRHSQEALAQHRLDVRAAKRRNLDDEIGDILDYERSFADSPWPGRLARAADKHAVIREWKEARGIES